MKQSTGIKKRCKLCEEIILQEHDEAAASASFVWSCQHCWNVDESGFCADRWLLKKKDTNLNYTNTPILVYNSWKSFIGQGQFRPENALRFLIHPSQRRQWRRFSQ